MVRKRKKQEEEKPWCFYCDREFNVSAAHRNFACERAYYLLTPPSIAKYTG